MDKFYIGRRVKFNDGNVSGIGIIVGVPPEGEYHKFNWTVVTTHSTPNTELFYEDVDGYRGVAVRHFDAMHLEIAE